MIQHEWLRDEFGYKPADQKQAKACVAIRTAFFNLANLVMNSAPPSRAQTLALDDMVRACRASIAAVMANADVDPNSVPPRAP